MARPRARFSWARLRPRQGTGRLVSVACCSSARTAVAVHAGTDPARSGSSWAGAPPAPQAARSTPVARSTAVAARTGVTASAAVAGNRAARFTGKAYSRPYATMSRERFLPRDSRTRRSPVTSSEPPAADPQARVLPGGVDLSASEFWGLPLPQRRNAFAGLRSLPQPPFFADPALPFAASGGGYYALVRHADVSEASRNPEVFCSGQGATSLVDLPVEFNEYFGSMINMDDPRHARLRRIVSRAFTPRMIRKFEDDVQRTAAVIVDELLATGPCDFVGQVAAKLPLKIICGMMGIGEEHYDMVLRNTNTILSGFDPEFISADMDEAITQLLTAGQDLATLVTGLAADRQESPADDLTSALANAN